MPLSYEQLFTQSKPVSLPGKFVQFPLTRIFIAFLFIAPVLILSNLWFRYGIKPLSDPYLTILKYPRELLSIVGFIFAYRWYTRLIEKRECHEMNFQKSASEFGIGALISAGVVAIMVALLAGLSFYRIESFNSWPILFRGLFHFGVASFVEELIFRIILFKLIEEEFGSWTALVLIGSLFGFIHIVNPNATIWSSLSLVIVDGLIYGGALMLTRRVWMIWGLHLSWNFFQTAVFGMPNSGITSHNLISPVITGPDWITGGNFGIEASLVRFGLSAVVGVLILRKAIIRGQAVKPAWKR